MTNLNVDYQEYAEKKFSALEKSMRDILESTDKLNWFMGAVVFVMFVMLVGLFFDAHVGRVSLNKEYTDLLTGKDQQILQLNMEKEIAALQIRLEDECAGK